MQLLYLSIGSQNKSSSFLVQRRSLRIYTSDGQDDWDSLLIEAELAYNHARSSATGLSPFEVLYGTNPYVPASLLRDPKVTAAPPTVQELLSGHWTRLGAVQDQLGPFKILERPSALNYKLALHPDSKIHPVFHVSLLKPVTPRDPREAGCDELVSAEFPGDQALDSLPLLIEDDSARVYDGEWEVEAIRGHRNRRGQRFFCVKWIGCPESSNTWEPEDHLRNAKELLDRYKESKGL